MSESRIKQITQIARIFCIGVLSCFGSPLLAGELEGVNARSDGR